MNKNKKKNMFFFYLDFCYFTKYLQLYLHISYYYYYLLLFLLLFTILDFNIGCCRKSSSFDFPLLSKNIPSYKKYFNYILILYHFRRGEKS